MNEIEMLLEESGTNFRYTKKQGKHTEADQRYIDEMISRIEQIKWNLPNKIEHTQYYYDGDKITEEQVQNFDRNDNLSEETIAIYTWEGVDHSQKMQAWQRDSTTLVVVQLGDQFLAMMFSVFNLFIYTNDCKIMISDNRNRRRSFEIENLIIANLVEYIKQHVSEYLKREKV
jgi:hypothetical protein